MPLPCDIATCKRKSRALCYCCNKKLCVDHVKEHDDSSNSQVNPIADELNAISNQLLKMNMHNVIGNCQQKLDQWRNDCHTMIDRLYQQKSQELSRRCLKRNDQLWAQIDQMRLKTNELIREQEATYEDIPLMKCTINDIKRDVNEFQEQGVIVHVRPLTIDENLIHIEERSTINVDVSSLSVPLRKIDCSDKGWSVMACNNQFLLVNQHPRLSIFNQELNIIKQFPWEYSHIPDMCWSSTLNQFIITTKKDGVFLVDENLTSITSIETIEKKNWLSCTCSENALFLTTNEAGSQIFQFNLLSSFRLIKQWNPPQSCHSGECIHNSDNKNSVLALTIEYAPERQMKIELVSPTTFDRLYSLPLNFTYSGGRITRVCSVRCDEWLVIDRHTSRLLQITKDGKLKFEHKYPSTPHNAVLFRSNILAIRTDKCLDFYTV